MLSISCLTSCVADEEATTGSLHGTIKDSENGNLLKGCLVVISPTGKSITTGDDGSFSFDNLAAGVFSIDVSKNDYEPAKKEVTIVAGQPNKADMQLTKQMPKLSVNKINLDFSDSETELPIEIRNDGKSTLKWEISTGTKWIKINPTSGTSTKDIASVLISVDRTGLSKGDYNGSINITSNGGTATIKVNMSIKGAVLKVTPSTLDFGEIETSKELFISNETEIGSITYSIQPSVNWIILSSNEGTVDTNTDKIKVLVNRDGLATNDYNEKLTINTKDGRKEISVIVKQIVRTVAIVGIGSSFSVITETSFSIKGTILSTGGHEISSYGHCWSEHDTPTIENDNKNNFGNSTEIREFTSNISGLGVGKTYYVRAYAVNDKGTVYSEQKNITMPYIEKPTVKTETATNIDKDIATLNGTIIDNGGDKIIECGFYYGTNINPEIKKTLGDNNSSTLKLVLTNLKEGTTYYYKAYATNSKGTSYGEVLSFNLNSDIHLTTNGTNVLKTYTPSGGEKILVIDGEPQSMPSERGECMNYFIVQAYECSGDANLDSRLKSTIDNFDGYLSPQEVAKKYIVTENFESFAQDGGVAFTDRYGNKMQSLEGMARWTPIIDDQKVSKGGVGTYHMEYDYPFTPEYKWLRAAIQIMNPSVK